MSLEFQEFTFLNHSDYSDEQKAFKNLYLDIKTDDMPQGTAIQIMKIIGIEIGNFERQGIKIVDKSAETIFMDKFSGILDKDIYLFKLNYKITFIRKMDM